MRHADLIRGSRAKVLAGKRKDGTILDDVIDNCDLWERNLDLHAVVGTMREARPLMVQVSLSPYLILHL